MRQGASVRHGQDSFIFTRGSDRDGGYSGLHSTALPSCRNSSRTAASGAVLDVGTAVRSGAGLDTMTLLGIYADQLDARLRLLAGAVPSR
jgi:hypothetical protein